MFGEFCPFADIDLDWVGVERYGVDSTLRIEKQWRVSVAPAVPVALDDLLEGGTVRELERTFRTPLVRSLDTILTCKRIEISVCDVVG